MATRKKVKKRVKPQYVRAKKRKGAESSALARRAVTVALLLLIFAGVFFGISSGFKWVGRKLFSGNKEFEIQHLVVSSDGGMKEDHILEVTDLRRGMNLFEVGFKEIESRLLAVSRVESVQLRRELPHTLVVRVKERVPMAQIVGARNQKYMVDRFGYVLPRRKSFFSLPLIKGLDIELHLGEQTDHPDVETALEIIALCESTSYLRTYVHIESLDVKYSDYIVMQLTEGGRVRMPRYSIEPKLLDLASIIEVSMSKGKRVKEVDLTVDSPKVKVPVRYY